MIPQIMQVLMILCSLLIASASATSSPCPHPCKCSTTDNGIQVANCTDLPDQMTTAWPQKILRIHFDGHHASPIMLKNKAFKHFPQLTYLDITGGTIQYVGNLAFDGLPELVELNLVGTGIRKLHQNTFVSNRKLAFLSLRNNPRLFIAPSFLVSESITELDLSECALNTLKSVYFKSLPNLKYLFVMKNELKFLGSQFGPSSLKYVNLADNRIENIYEDLDVYKRLRTIDLTGNPINCTCELSEIDTKLTAKGVAFGNTIVCKNTGKPLGDLIEKCSDKEMMGDDPGEIIKSDNMLPINNSSKQLTDENDDFGSGSGSGDGDLIFPEFKNSQQENVKNITPNIESTTKAKDVDDFISTTTQIINIPIEEIITNTKVYEQLAQPNASEIPVIETTTLQSININVTSEVVETTTNIAEEKINVHVPDSIPETTSDNLTLVQSNVDRGILPQTIQAAEVPQEDDVETRVSKYLKSNAVITGTALILAVVIIAIVYKAVCLGKSRRHSIHVQANNKSVELKDVKYMPTETEDSHNQRDDNTPSSSVEDNLIDDHDDSGDDDEDHDGDVTSPPVTSVNDNHAQNGLLNSVLDAVKNNIGEPLTNNSQSQDLQVPTRVVVKLCETPKASKPITINNVH